MQKVLLFANPIAGRGSALGIGRTLCERLNQEGFACDFLTDRPEGIDPATLCDPNLRCIIIIGGDGTLRSVASRMVDHCPPQHWPPLLMVPMGTANLMAQHLGLRWDKSRLDQQVSDAIRQLKIIPLDTAKANDRLFLLMAGVGIDAQIVHEVDRRRRGPIRKSSYVWPAMQVVGGYDYSPITVHADGARVFGPIPGVAFIGNVREYGIGFPMLPHARSDDGVLDLCALPCGSRWQMIKLLAHAAAGEHHQLEGSVYLKARRVEIESDRPMAVQVDGEPAGFTPVRIRMLEHKLRFVVE